MIKESDLLFKVYTLHPTLPTPINPLLPFLLPFLPFFLESPCVCLWNFSQRGCGFIIGFVVYGEVVVVENW